MNPRGKTPRPIPCYIPTDGLPTRRPLRALLGLVLVPRAEEARVPARGAEAGELAGPAEDPSRAQELVPPRRRPYAWALVALLLVACGGEAFESRLFVQTGGAAGAAAVGGSGGTAAGSSGGTAGAAGTMAVGGSAGAAGTVAVGGAAGAAGTPQDAGTDTCAPVDDGNACTTDACDGTHSPLPGIDDGKACTVDSCNTATGTITHEQIEDKEFCALEGFECPTGFYPWGNKSGCGGIGILVCRATC